MTPVSEYFTEYFSGGLPPNRHGVAHREGFKHCDGMKRNGAVEERGSIYVENVTRTIAMGENIKIITGGIKCEHATI